MPPRQPLLPAQSPTPDKPSVQPTPQPTAVLQRRHAPRQMTLELRRRT